MGWYETHVFNAVLDRQLDKPAIHRERRAVLAPAHGDILELGIGTGLNFPLYPASVDRITGLGPDPALDRRALGRAAARRLTVDYVAGDARALPFDAGSFDTVVSTLVLCTVPEPHRAVAEVLRVLRPGGSFLVFEHVIWPKGWLRGLQRILDPPNRLFGCGCSLVCDTHATIAAAGFSELALEELQVSGLALPGAWVLRGYARR
jgi:ubiquinone/menaquinone biosynthesis C-methylase UbiE